MIVRTLSIFFAVFGKINGEECHLPAGKVAKCVPISQCNNIRALIGNLQKPLPQDVALLINESYFCGTRQECKPDVFLNEDSLEQIDISLTCFVIPKDMYKERNFLNVYLVT